MLIEREPALAHVGGVQRAGIVTPMETEVSGLILAGRDEATYRRLKGEVNRGRVERRYIALVEGLLKGEGVIEAPIGNRRHERRRLRVSRTGRAATTRYRALTTYRSWGGPTRWWSCAPIRHGGINSASTWPGTARRSSATGSTAPDAMSC